jgi:hypothetical protein
MSGNLLGIADHNMAKPKIALTPTGTPRIFVQGLGGRRKGRLLLFICERCVTPTTSCRTCPPAGRARRLYRIGSPHRDIQK